MKKIIIILIICTCIFNIQAQEANKWQSFKKYEELSYYYKQQDYISALPVLRELEEMDSTVSEINYKLAISIYFTETDATNAIKYFERAKPDYVDAYYYLGILYHLNTEFLKSEKAFNHYKNSVLSKKFTNEDIDFYTKKINIAKAYMSNPQYVDIINLGKQINTEYAEYVPILTKDESTLYFTSRRPGSTGGFLDENKEFYEDIYFSKKVNGQWSQPQNAGIPINSDDHETCVAISSDGKSMYLSRRDSEYETWNIFHSEWQDTIWSEPTKIRADINSRNGLELSIGLSPDERILYFVSTRPGGYGGKDIWKVAKMPNGKWSLAQNLGPTINTPYDEDAPYMHPDGETLYFSSKGHENMGGFDIFKSKLDKKGKWSTPENLGYPINTVKSDVYFAVSSDGLRGYYSSLRKDGYGLSDIYMIDMPETKPEFIIVKGIISSNDTLNQSIGTEITVRNKKTNEIHGIYRSNEKTGKYILVLFPHRQYDVEIEDELHGQYKESITTDDGTKEKYISKNIKLNKPTLIPNTENKQKTSHQTQQ